jgi:uncharacterized spore protein YtfJ
MVIETLVKTVLTELREMTKTETVIGKAMKVGDVTVIPISRISVGFGVGGGKGMMKKTDGEATGGGASIQPIGFIVVMKDKVDLITIGKEEVGLGKVIDLVPQIIEKVKTYREKKDKPEEKDGKQKK